MGFVAQGQQYQKFSKSGCLWPVAACGLGFPVSEAADASVCYQKLHVGQTNLKRSLAVECLNKSSIYRKFLSMPFESSVFFIRTSTRSIFIPSASHAAMPRIKR